MKTTDNINRWLLHAKDKCLQHEYPKELDSRHCALLVSGGNVISIGYNKLSNQELRFPGGKKVSRRPQSSEHAEMQAIMAVRRKIDLTNCKMFVVRVNRQEELSMSRPCILCAPQIANYGIARVYYSISETEYAVWNVKKQFETKLSKK